MKIFCKNGFIRSLFSQKSFIVVIEKPEALSETIREYCNIISVSSRTLFRQYNYSYKILKRYVNCHISLEVSHLFQTFFS